MQEFSLRPKSANSYGRFLLLTFALSSLFYLLGALSQQQFLPGVPISAVMVLCPLAAALLLVYQTDRRAGVVELLKRSFDFQRSKAKVWYLPLLLLMPGVMTLEFGILRWFGSPIPLPQFSVLKVLGLLLALFITALMEELGWMGYAIEPMQARFGTLHAGILLGLVWVAWHFIPLVQVGRSWDWMAWWSLYTVAQRVIIVWLYNRMGRSVFAATLYHTMMNLTWQLFPVNGSFYDPRITALIVTLVAVIGTLASPGNAVVSEPPERGHLSL
ncbi:MAG: CPBP family intramembrane glutamic endopeptidase [Caldilineaceae bacterium]